MEGLLRVQKRQPKKPGASASSLGAKKETDSPATVEVAAGQRVNQDTRTGGAYGQDNQCFQRCGHFGRERGPGSCWATVGWDLLAFVGKPGHPAPIIQVLTLPPQPILNNSRQSEALLNGIDLITDMVARHRIIIGPYLTKKPGLEDGIYIINEELHRTTIKLYTIVLEYQAKAAYYINRGTLARVVHNIPKLDDWNAMRWNIIPIESDCREYNFCNHTLKQESSLQTLTKSRSQDFQSSSRKSMRTRKMN